MRAFIIFALCLALAAACCLGITHSLVLQGPVLVLLGLTAILSCLITAKIQIHLGWLLPVLLATAYFLTRSWLSPVQDLALEDSFLILGVILLYLLGGVVVGFPMGRSALAWTLVLVLCLHLGSAFMQAMGENGYGVVWLFTSGQRADGDVITGMYGYRGSFANFAAVGGVVSLSLGIWGRSKKWLRGILILIGLLALVCVCLSQSRSAVMSLAVGVVTMLVLLWLSVANQEEKIRKRFRGVTAIAGGLGLVLSVIAVVWVFQSRALKAEGADVAFDSDVRLAYWSMAVEQFVENPIFGAGSRSYSYECFHYWSPNIDTGEANPEFVHNEYLQLLADYGLIGFLIIVALLGGHLVYGVIQVRSLSARVSERGLGKGSDAMALSIAGVTGIVIVGFHMISDFRTHLLANLLILICCAIWVLPTAKIRESGKQWISVVLLVTTLLMLGSLAIYQGAKEFRGGLPLLKNKMATETGTWTPANVDRAVWIPTLEKAVESAPSYRRYLRLGALYRLEAVGLGGEERKLKLEQSINHYQEAELRHPYDPVAKLNLAILFTDFQNYEQSERYYSKADEMASSRERWFRIRTKWADMQRQWAGSAWKSGNTQEAEKHYLRALEILENGKVQSGDTILMRFMVVIEYCRMLDSIEEFDKAGGVFEELEKKSKVYHINSLKLNIRREMAEHYLNHAKHLWYQRKPEQAYPLLLEAKRSYQIHRVVLRGKQDKVAETGTLEVKDILKFFKETGLGE